MCSKAANIRGKPSFEVLPVIFYNVSAITPCLHEEKGEYDSRVVCSRYSLEIVSIKRGLDKQEKSDIMSKIFLENKVKVRSLERIHTPRATTVLVTLLGLGLRACICFACILKGMVFNPFNLDSLSPAQAKQFGGFLVGAAALYIVLFTGRAVNQINQERIRYDELSQGPPGLDL
eukprot:g61584.t1